MVTIEKWQGADVRPYLWEEDAWLVAAAQVKRRSPNTTVVVWFDSLRIYTDNKTLNPDITPACTTGHLRASQFLETHSSYLLKNTSGSPALDPWSGCHIIDHTNARARAFWTEMCLDMTTSGVVDGCGAILAANPTDGAGDRVRRGAAAGQLGRREPHGREVGPGGCAMRCQERERETAREKKSARESEVDS